MSATCAQRWTPRREAFESLEKLQAETDARLEDRARRLRCPLTGASIAAAWQQERRLLTPLPETLPDPFDVVVGRPVGIDCLVSFEGRRYSVPFRFARQEVEVRWLAGRVQTRGRGYQRVRAPMPLGRMGRCLQEVAAGNVQHRSSRTRPKAARPCTPCSWPRCGPLTDRRLDRSPGRRL